MFVPNTLNAVKLVLNSPHPSTTWREIESKATCRRMERLPGSNLYEIDFQYASPRLISIMTPEAITQVALP